jgi:pilus assembly protein CpaB
MLIRVILIAMMSLGLAGFGGVAWLSYRTPKAEASHIVPATEQVLVMAKALPGGSLLKPDDLVAKEMPASGLPESANLDTPDNRRSLNGAMLRRGAAAGDLLLSGDVTRPGDHGFLAAVLTPGMRAVTVGVDTVSGMAGLIWPGDRIDLIMTQSMEGADVPLSRRVSAEAVLQDVRVIAIDQRLVQGMAPAEPSGNTARTVTLEVTQDQASRVAVASRIGRLSLSVRAVAAGPASAATPDARPLPASASNAPIWAGDVSRSLPDSVPAAAPAKVLRVFQGSTDGKEYRF